MSTIDKRLAEFRAAKNLRTKGKLAAMLHASRLAIEHGLPIDATELVTDGRGQVKGLGKGRVQSILADHGVTRTLAEEAGRTSRGNLGDTIEYVEFLNELSRERPLNPAELASIETWWVQRVLDFFASKPFSLKYDASRSMRAIVRDLLDQAVKRQSENPGTQYAGAVMQHLVGAKLSLLLGDEKVQRFGFSVADEVSGRGGDFVIGDIAMHVTTMPGEALMRKCRANLEAGIRPVIVTMFKHVPGAESLAEIQGVSGRVDIWEAEQFLATNIYEMSSFQPAQRKLTIDKVVDKYNEIVDECETDPSLRIAVA